MKIMNKENIQNIIKEIDALIEYYDGLRKQAQYDDLSDLDDSITTEAQIRLASCIDRIAPLNSPYRKNIDSHCSYLVGTLKALRADYQAGFIAKIESMIQGDLFADFLEMAKYLLDNKYKNPAAVIIGAVLEEQLRIMCGTNNIPVTRNNKYVKADTMNTELAKVTVTSKLDQKSITAWLDLRNKAAHGRFNEYTVDQVKLMYQGVQDFIIRMT